MKLAATLNTEQAMSVMRDHGVRISYRKLVDLMSGGVPWGRVSVTDTGRKRWIIFRKPLIEWLESLSEEADE